MKNVQAAEQILREVAASSGLTPVVDYYDGRILFAAVDADAMEARFCTSFATSLSDRTSRPFGRALIAATDLVDADPAQLNVVVKSGVAAAKAEIIAQMKATIARLEALP